MRGLRLAYNTNGLADYRLEEALEFLADCGYDGVGLTLNHYHLDPFAPDLHRRLESLGSRLQRLGLAVVVETGARYLLDPRRKHEPNLMSEHGRELRIDLLRRAVWIASALGADTVSLWSGASAPDLDPGIAWRRLIDGCEQVLETAEQHGITLGFEPEPGHLVDRLERYDELAGALGNPSLFGLTLDVGHCLCQGEDPVGSILERGDRLVNVHIEDMRRGVHEHLDFGEGEMDFPPVLSALSQIGYQGLVCVELSRHSHAAHAVVPRSIQFLREAEREGILA